MSPSGVKARVSRRREPDSAAPSWASLILLLLLLLPDSAHGQVRPTPHRVPWADSGLWLAGDMHAHSTLSGDSELEPASLARKARSAGCDFLALTDHGEIIDKKRIEQRTKEYEDKFANPFIAAQMGFIDDVIMPHSTRPRLARGLKMLEGKKLENPWRKHGNIPL